MKRRLFIAINLDPRVRQAIEGVEKDIEDVFGWEREEQVRFTPEENWHITISFLGTQDDADLPLIMEAMRETTKHFPVIDISFTEVAYMPQRNNPRLICLGASQATNRALGEVKNSLGHLLAVVGIRSEQKPGAFSGHITLARLWSDASQVNLPPVERSIAINFDGTTLDLMESELDREGAVHTLLQKFPFAEKR